MSLTLIKICEDALNAMEHPAVQCVGDWQTGLFCGLEDQNITDRYDACMYGYCKALERVREWVICDMAEIVAKEKEETMSCKNCKFWYLEKEEHKTGQCRRHAPYTIVAGCGIGERPEYSCSWFFTWLEDCCGEFQKLNRDEGE